MRGYNQNSETESVEIHNQGLRDRDSGRLQSGLRDRDSGILQSQTHGQRQWEVTIIDSGTGTVEIHNQGLRDRDSGRL